MTKPFDVHEVQATGRRVGSVLRPTSVTGALQALSQNVGSRPLAGGTDLLLELKRQGSGDAAVLVEDDDTFVEGFEDLFEEAFFPDQTGEQLLRLGGVDAVEPGEEFFEEAGLHFDGEAGNRKGAKARRVSGLGVLGWMERLGGSVLPAIG